MLRILFSGLFGRPSVCAAPPLLRSGVAKQNTKKLRPLCAPTGETHNQRRPKKDPTLKGDPFTLCFCGREKKRRQYLAVACARASLPFFYLDVGVALHRVDRHTHTYARASPLYPPAAYLFVLAASLSVFPPSFFVLIAHADATSS
nr:hypothetical protein [Pandoravirus massiliensis]